MKKNEKYICPMHRQIKSDKPGRCTLCGMRLVKKGEQTMHNTTEHKKNSINIKDYAPLITVISLILFVSIVITIKDISLGQFSLMNTMRYSMAGFFLTFSGFKLLDLPGFAQGYSTYDLIARRIFLYGYVYPFIELAFGLTYLLGYMPFWVNAIVAIVMGISGFGVLDKLQKKERFQCACLGTFLKVPLTTITLIEDFGMVTMAIVMNILLR